MDNDPTLPEAHMATDKILFFFLSILLIISLAAAGARAEIKKPAAGPKSAKSASGPVTAIQVSFKVKEITPQSFYVGDVWVPTIISAEVGETVTVEAKAVGLDVQGNRMDINPTWKAADPVKIKILPDQGPKVKLTALQIGRNTVTVSFAGISQNLPLRSWKSENIMYLKISQ